MKVRIKWTDSVLELPDTTEEDYIKSFGVETLAEAVAADFDQDTMAFLEAFGSEEIGDVELLEP